MDVYHINTRLKDGRESLLIDPGSVGNLCGNEWAKGVAKMATSHGKNPSYEKRARPLQVSGVGHGSQFCEYDCKLPLAFKQLDNRTAPAELRIPTVSNSKLPGLLGLEALRRNRAVLDFQKLELHFLGGGEYRLQRELPPGTLSMALEIAPSGHLALPCCEYGNKGPSQSQGSLTLLAQDNAPKFPPPTGPAPTFEDRNTPAAPGATDSRSRL